MKPLAPGRTVLTGLCLLLLVAALGCDIEIGGRTRARHERTIALSIPFALGSTVDVHTQLGSVTITGADVADCNVVAEIIAGAPTEEEARQLAEQVRIRTESSGATLRIQATKPRLTNDRSIGVNYIVTVPRQTNAVCHSAYGPLEIVRLNGNVTAKTRSGSVKVRDIEGSVDLDTSYGSVTCANVTGETVKLRSSSGSITVTGVRASLQAETAYGSIACEEISADELKLKSSSGKIALSNATFSNCDAHTSYGGVQCNGLKGGSIKLHSDSGSLDVLHGSADTIDLSTSYGRIKGDDIATAKLTANSSSGNVDVACSPSAPPDLTADVKSGYGRIQFIAPPAFTGSVHLATSYGSVRTERPITVSGEITEKKVAGKIGDGAGLLRIETSSGSIVLK